MYFHVTFLYLRNKNKNTNINYNKLNRFQFCQGRNVTLKLRRKKRKYIFPKKKNIQIKYVFTYVHTFVHKIKILNVMAKKNADRV